MSSFSGLSIGASALRSYQVALNTVGHNVSNSSTEGYSRQVVQLNPGFAQVRTYGAMGTGVNVKYIKRIADEYLESQVRDATCSTENLDTLQTGYTKIEDFFNELSDTDISSAMDRYWSSLSDVANNVEDTSTRTEYLAQAEALAESINNLNDNLLQYRLTLNDDVENTVSQVNTLTTEIADLNCRILRQESGGATGITANDLRDQREVLIKQLCGIMDVTVNEEDNGSVTIAQHGQTLVYQDESYDLAARAESVDGFVVKTPVMAESGKRLTIDGGSLGGLLDLRDNVIPSYMGDLDTFASSIIWETNRIASQGCGLNGYDAMTGTTSVTNPATTLDSLKYTFTPVGDTYKIENGHFNMIVYDTESGEETTVGVEIDLDGVPAEADTILYDSANPAAANSLINKMQAALDSAASGAFTVSLNNQNQVVIKSNTSEYQFGFGEDTSGAVAALGLNTIFDGFNADTIAVNQTMMDNPQYLQGAVGFIEGDNTNALALLNLQSTGVLNGGTSTIDDYYQGIIGRLGTESESVTTRYETASDVLTSAKNQRESLSGVSLDEELTLMLQFQRAYQSAARFITAVDECLQTILSM